MTTLFKFNDNEQTSCFFFANRICNDHTFYTLTNEPDAFARRRWQQKSTRNFFFDEGLSPRQLRF